MLVGSVERWEAEGAVWALMQAEVEGELVLRLVEAAVELLVKRDLGRRHSALLAPRARGCDRLWVVVAAGLRWRMIEIVSYRIGMDRSRRHFRAADSVAQMVEEGASIEKVLEAQPLVVVEAAEQGVPHQAVEAVVRRVLKMAAVVEEEELGVRLQGRAALERAMLAVEEPYQMAFERMEEGLEASCQLAAAASASRLCSRPAIPQA